MPLRRCNAHVPVRQPRPGTSRNQDFPREHLHSRVEHRQCSDPVKHGIQTISLIMIDPNDKDGRYLIESRLENFVEGLHIDKSKIQSVQQKTAGWNLRMMSLSAALCMLSMIPYVFLNVKPEAASLLTLGGRSLPSVQLADFSLPSRCSSLFRRWISEHCWNETRFEESGKSKSDDTNDVERNRESSVRQPTLCRQQSLT